MIIIRNLEYFVAAALLVSLPTAGCSKDEEKADGEATGGETAAKQEESKQAEASKYSFLPADSSLVFGINLGQIRSSKVFKDMVKPALAQHTSPAGEDYEQIETACGFDPVEQVEWIVIGGAPGEQDRMSMVIQGLSAEQVKTCGENMTEIRGTQVELTQEGKLTKLVAGEAIFWMGWVDDSTMVSTGPNKELLEPVMAGKEGLSGNETMMGLVGNVDTSAALWLSVDETSAPSPMTGVDGAFKSAHGSVSLAQGLLVKATVTQGSPEEARKAVAEYTEQLEQMKESSFGKYLSKLEFEANESDVVAQLDMNDAELMEMLNAPQLQMLKSMLGL